MFGVGDVLSAAHAAALAGCEHTKTLVARAGRTTYMDKARVKGHMDAGAYAVCVWLSALREWAAGQGVAEG